MGGLVIGDDERPRQILHLQQKDQTNPASLFLFCLPPRLSSRNVRDEPAMKWEVDVGEESRVSLPCSGLLFLLGTCRSPRDGSLARLKERRRNTGEEGGCARRATSHLRTGHCRAERRVITHAGGEPACAGENHDHVPIPRIVQSICNVWPGGTSAILTRDDHSSLYCGPLAGCRR